MNIIDISLSKLTILEPKPVDNKYLFQIQYNNDDFTFQTNGIMLFKTHNKSLSIVNKQDLLFLHNVYNLLIQNIFDNQQKWFENDFSIDVLKDMFVDILKPNIELNCVDLKCNLEILKDQNNDLDIIPLLKFSNILFDGKKFYITIDLAEHQIINNNKEKLENTNNLTNQSENNETQEDEEVNNETQEYNEEEQEQEEAEEEVDENEENSINEENEINNKQSQEEINEPQEEIEINTKNLEEINMKVDEDDFYIIYKLIQNNIYKNMNESLRNIFETKNVDTSSIDINELIYDSDDSDSEYDEDEMSAMVKNNDFENNFNKLL